MTPEHELAANEANFLWEKLVIVLHELSQSDRTKAYNFMVERRWNKDLLRLIWEDIEHLDRE